MGADLFFVADLSTSVLALSDEDLEALDVCGASLRQTSVGLGDWLQALARAERSRRDGRPIGFPWPAVDSWTDGQVAQALQGALSLAESMVSDAADQVARGVQYMVSAHAIIRLKGRDAVRSN